MLFTTFHIIHHIVYTRITKWSPTHLENDEVHVCIVYNCCRCVLITPSLSGSCLAGVRATTDTGPGTAPCVQCTVLYSDVYTCTVRHNACGGYFYTRQEVSPPSILFQQQLTPLIPWHLATSGIVINIVSFMQPSSLSFW